MIVPLPNQIGLECFDSCRSLHQVRHAPGRARDPRRHCRSAAKRVVAADEVVVREVKANRRLKVFPLLTEGVCQTRQPFHV